MTQALEKNEFLSCDATSSTLIWWRVGHLVNRFRSTASMLPRPVRTSLGPNSQRSSSLNLVGGTGTRTGRSSPLAVQVPESLRSYPLLHTHLPDDVRYSLAPGSQAALQDLVSTSHVAPDGHGHTPLFGIG